MARPGAESTASGHISTLAKPRRSDQFLAGLAPFTRIVFVSHVHPDPDSLAGMMGLAHLVQMKLGKPTLLTQDGEIGRAENRALVDLLHLDLQPVSGLTLRPGDGVVMVDCQPDVGRQSRCLRGNVHAVVDHHVTPGDLSGVGFVDVRPELGAACTLVSKYLHEQKVDVPAKLATVLVYAIETELNGFPRDASPTDDAALSYLYPLADKDLLAQIRHARLPRSHFETLAEALREATVSDRVLITWVDRFEQPEQAAEVVDFLIRYDAIDWAICGGVCRGKLILSARAARPHAQAGVLLRQAIGELGTAGGHERRAGGCVVLADTTDIERLRADLTDRLLRAFGAAADPIPLVETATILSQA